MAETINLFEFIHYRRTSPAFINKNAIFFYDFEKALEKAWGNRRLFSLSNDYYSDSTSKQQGFVSFGIKDIVPKNYLGTISFKSEGVDYVINFLPKIFHKAEYSDGSSMLTSAQLKSIFAHILWWLSASEKQNHSTVLGATDSIKSNLLEIMISIFSKFTNKILSTQPYYYYQNIEEDIQTVRGKIKFSSYLKQFANGSRHILTCEFDTLQYDNLFTRIIKFVTTYLRNNTSNTDTKKELEQLLFLLDEVGYEEVTANDCDRVIINPIFTEYKIILDYCKMFLSSVSVLNQKKSYNVFSILIPSEKLFENFILSIFKKYRSPAVRHVSNLRSDKAFEGPRLPSFLVKEKGSNLSRYEMRNDIVLQLRDLSYIIIDTKYKKVYFNDEEKVEEVDTVYKITRSDIYQMVAYAVGSNVDYIGMVYPSVPNTESKSVPPVYTIIDQLSENKKVINIHPVKVDIIHKDEPLLNFNSRLNVIFEESEIALAEELNSFISNIILSRPSA